MCPHYISYLPFYSLLFSGPHLILQTTFRPLRFKSGSKEVLPLKKICFYHLTKLLLLKMITWCSKGWETCKTEVICWKAVLLHNRTVETISAAGLVEWQQYVFKGVYFWPNCPLSSVTYTLRRAQTLATNETAFLMWRQVSDKEAWGVTDRSDSMTGGGDGRFFFFYKAWWIETGVTTSHWTDFFLLRHGRKRVN